MFDPVDALTELRKHLQSAMRLTAMDLLARREHSQQELAQKLAERKERLLQRAYHHTAEKLGISALVPDDVLLGGPSQRPRRGRADKRTPPAADEDFFKAEVDNEQASASELAQLNEATPPDDSSPARSGSQEEYSAGAGQQASQQALQRALHQLSDTVSDITADVIAQLQQEGLQSDARFAEAYTNKRARAGFGPVRIKLELQRLGIDDTAFLYEACDWPQLLIAAATKKSPHWAGASAQQRAKLSRFLQYRGFAADAIHSLWR